MNFITLAFCLLEDVKRWLGELRGKDLPGAFAWSYKRLYQLHPLNSGFFSFFISSSEIYFLFYQFRWLLRIGCFLQSIVTDNYHYDIAGGTKLVICGKTCWMTTS